MNLFNFYIHRTRKSEKHKESFLCENYELTFPTTTRKQSNPHEEHKQSFFFENYNRIFHNKSIKKHEQSSPVKI